MHVTTLEKEKKGIPKYWIPRLLGQNYGKREKSEQGGNTMHKADDETYNRVRMVEGREML